MSDAERPIAGTGIAGGYAARILRVLVHLQSRLDDELSLDELAAVACFSPFHFHRVFRGLVGESVMAHVRRLRLERAAHHLRQTRRPVGEIALDAGYEAPEAFARAFRSAFGSSPSAYRRTRAAAAARLGAPSGIHFDPEHAAPPFSPFTGKEQRMKLEIRSLPPQRVAFLRHVGPYDQVGETWERLGDWVGSELLFGPSTLMLGVCWDDPEVTPAEKIRYDACVTVEDGFAPSGAIGVQTLPGGEYAVTLHEGPYSGLGETYAALFSREIPRLGREAGDPPTLEVYLNDPESTEPEDLLTEVCVRLRDGGAA